MLPVLRSNVFGPVTPSATPIRDNELVLLPPLSLSSSSPLLSLSSFIKLRLCSAFFIMTCFWFLQDLMVSREDVSLWDLVMLWTPDDLS